VSAGGDERPSHATRRPVIAGVLAPRGVRAGTDAGRTRAAEGHGRRLILCTRNRTDPISGFANNGDAPVEHNFGHGYQHVSTVLMHLMMLAFLIDQIQQCGYRLFPAALAAAKTKSRLWRKLRRLFNFFRIPSWEGLSHAVIDPPAIELTYDTS